jgi:hypothetical protein
MRQPNNRHNETGNALVEFSLCFPVLVLALFGVVTGGLALDRYMTVLQLGRTGASMMQRGVDFNSTQNKQLFLRGAADLGIELNSGQGVIYLTRLEKAPPDTANDGQMVIAERYVIGNTSIASSTVGQPASSIWPDPTNPNVNGDVKDRNNEGTAVANTPAALNTLALGESMYVAEVYTSANGILFGNVWGADPRLATVVYF